MNVTVTAANTKGVNLGNASFHPVVRAHWLWSEGKMVLLKVQGYLYLDPAVPATPCILALPTAALGSLSSDVLLHPPVLADTCNFPCLVSEHFSRLRRTLSHCELENSSGPGILQARFPNATGCGPFLWLGKW